MYEELDKYILSITELLVDYLDDLVIGGGWVPFFYYKYLLNLDEFDHTSTKDFDLLVKNQVQKRGNKTIDEILNNEGFKSVPKGSGKIPVIHYEGNYNGINMEIEFITNLKGNKDVRTIKVQEDLYAEALKFIDISIKHTQKIKLANNLIVKIPRPSAFIFNKGLVYKRRNDKLKSEKGK